MYNSTVIINDKEIENYKCIVQLLTYRGILSHINLSFTNMKNYLTHSTSWLYCLKTKTKSKKRIFFPPTFSVDMQLKDYF